MTKMEHPRLKQSVDEILEATGQPKDHHSRSKITAVVNADFHLGATMKVHQIREVIGLREPQEDQTNA